MNTKKRVKIKKVLDIHVPGNWLFIVSSISKRL